MRKKSINLADNLRKTIEKVRSDYNREFLKTKSKAYLQDIIDGKIDIESYTSDFKAFLTAHNIPDKVINLIID